MLSIAICDDNNKDSARIAKFIKSYMKCGSISFQINIFKSGEDLLDFQAKFDLIFLDIALSGLNGIQVGKTIWEKNRNVKVIYTTSYKQFCRQAVNYVHAFAFLEKPVTKDSVERQLHEIIQYIQEEHGKIEVVNFEILEVTEAGELESSIKSFEVNDIFYFEYINRRIKIKLENEEYFFVDKMKDLADRMQKYNFEACHQSVLVNLRHIKNIKGYEVMLNNNDKLPVSQKKSAEFRKKLNKFIQSNV
jgi:DNA-binding LytR/AlgR family response regulator